MSNPECTDATLNHSLEYEVCCLCTKANLSPTVRCVDLKEACSTVLPTAGFEAHIAQQYRAVFSGIELSVQSCDDVNNSSCDLLIVIFPWADVVFEDSLILNYLRLLQGANEDSDVECKIRCIK
ncbi:hypothetical protein AB6A40_001451 [Gnathostoma spinigerum]|uniref:Uncharacterized protein n=1 Tax=Gnathostoma spinigerum TaxID=75299 RepID=A0ABD6E696_9BILA